MSTPVRSIETATPMMRQYLEIKAQVPDAILFFRLGDFYEMFDRDAEIASEILEIALTSRGQKDDRIPMCGVPFHSAKGYVAKLIEAGHKVAICEQVEGSTPPKGRGLVRREVTRVVTPGMVLDDELLDARSDHFLATVAEGEGRWGLALLDASTGEFRAAEFAVERLLQDELQRLRPREVIVPKGSELLGKIRSVCAGAVVQEAREEGTFDVKRAERRLREQLGVASLEGFGLGGLPLATSAAGAALAYLSETQRGEAARHVDRVQVYHPEGHLILDEATRSNLEILRTLHGGKKRGSLLGQMDKSSTPMGGRTLARWIAAPLLDRAEIARRHDAVEELSKSAVRREELIALLRKVGDVERILGRLALRAGMPRDAKNLGKALAVLPEVQKGLEGCESALLREVIPDLGGLEDLAEALERALEEELPATLREGGIFRKGWDPELDELIELSSSGKEYLLRLEQREREQTGISSLKVRYNRVFGYYIEVTKSNLQLVPEHYRRKQTTANAERYTTDELQRYEEKVVTAEERRIEREALLFEELRQRIVGRSSEIKRAAAAVGRLDALLAFARVAADYGYVRPEVDESDAIEIVEGRHPVVELTLSGESFVPNDLFLDRKERQVLVITGPNMAGKSTVLRQTALIVLLAQAGSFVPASRARIGLVDRIFCRVGASDDIAKGQSTFMVEMVETAAILHGATERSLVVLDEIGRGTSTFDGLSIAWAVAEHLHDVVGARTLFATHYHELVELARERKRVQNATIAVTERQGRVIFLRKLVDGGASRSYGIEVARLAGLPAEVLSRAREILANLEKNELDPEGRAVFAGKGRRGASAEPAQLSFFAPAPTAPSSEEKEVLEALRRLRPEELTPLEALNLLADLRAKL